MSKQLSKKIAVIGLSLVAIILTALVCVDSSHYGAYIAHHLIKQARENGINLSIDKTRYHGKSIELENVSIYLPRRLLEFKIDRTNIAVSILSLLRLAPYFTMHISAYGGNLKGNLLYTPKQNRGEGKVSGMDINVSKHNLIGGFGIISAVVAGNADFTFDNSGLLKLLADATLANIEKPQPTTLKAKLVNLPFDIILPPLTHGAISSHIEYASNELRLSDLKSNSSLGDLKGTAYFSSRLAKNPNQVRIDTTVSLTEEGLLAFGPYLSLFSGGSLNEKSKNFRMYIHGKLPLPEVRLSKTGG